MIVALGHESGDLLNGTQPILKLLWDEGPPEVWGLPGGQRAETEMRPFEMERLGRLGTALKDLFTPRDPNDEMTTDSPPEDEGQLRTRLELQAANVETVFAEQDPLAVASEVTRRVEARLALPLESLRFSDVTISEGAAVFTYEVVGADEISREEIRTRVSLLADTEGRVDEPVAREIIPGWDNLRAPGPVPCHFRLPFLSSFHITDGAKDGVAANGCVTAVHAASGWPLEAIKCEASPATERMHVVLERPESAPSGAAVGIPQLQALVRGLRSLDRMGGRAVEYEELWALPEGDCRREAGAQATAAPRLQ
eukprot:Polyplicarium_translucidae@DN1979_c0_g1_i3.p1